MIFRRGLVGIGGEFLLDAEAAPLGAEELLGLGVVTLLEDIVDRLDDGSGRWDAVAVDDAGSVGVALSAAYPGG